MNKRAVLRAWLLFLLVLRSASASHGEAEKPSHDWTKLLDVEGPKLSAEEQNGESDEGFPRQLRTQLPFEGGAKHPVLKNGLRTKLHEAARDGSLKDVKASTDA